MERYTISVWMCFAVRYIKRITRSPYLVNDNKKSFFALSTFPFCEVSGDELRSVWTFPVQSHLVHKQQQFGGDQATVDPKDRLKLA